MPQGMQVFNADGSLQFDTSARLLRVTKQVRTGTSNGSTVVPGLEQGSLLILRTVDDIGYHPILSVSGSTVSWAFDPEWPLQYRKELLLTFVVY